MAADYAEGKGPPPREYSLLLNMRDLGLGYVTGGLRDQPAWLMRRGRAAEMVINSVRQWKSMSLRKWVETATKSMRDTVDLVLQLRREARKRVPHG